MRLKDFGEIPRLCRLFFLQKNNLFIGFYKEIVNQIKRKREVDVKVLHLIKLTCSFRRYT